MAATQATPFVTPVGRLVQGDVFTPQTTNSEGQPLVYKSGPQAGQPRVQYFIAVAFQKNDPQWPAFYAQLVQAGRQGYPQFFNEQGQCVNPHNFSFKVIDGDGYDKNGKLNSEKPGFARHWVVRFTSSYATKAVQAGSYLNNPESIKRGYYIRVAGDVAPNTGSQTPGIYVNHSCVELVGYGEEIRGSVDAVSVFGAAGAVALPAGASATPIASAGGIMGSMPGAPAMQQPMMQPPAMQQPMMQPPAMQQPMMQPPAMQQPMMQPPAMQQPQPNHAFVQNAIVQPPVAQLIPTAAAQGFSVEQWKAAGYTEDMLVQNGMFTRG